MYQYFLVASSLLKKSVKKKQWKAECSLKSTNKIIFLFVGHSARNFTFQLSIFEIYKNLT